MGFMEKMQAGLESAVGPVAQKISENKFITAMSQGFMSTMPITLGVALIAILVNFPVAAWTELLKKIGVYTVAQDVVSVTLSMLALYAVGAIAYRYTKNEGKDELTGMIIALASFMILVPLQTLTDESGAGVASIATKYLGSDGIFIAIIIGLFAPWLFCKLVDKNLTIKLPEAVPPMVSQSLSPMFVSMIIFGLMFVIKFICSLTPFGNMFDMVTTLIGKPVTLLGGSPIALIVVYTLMNLFWFFGVHPNAILMCYMPVLMAASVENITAYQAGEALPHYMFAILGIICQIGGAGNTLGLCLATIFAKSEKYKAMRAAVSPANFFNINEPVIFGFPVMMNPLYFIPMVLSPLVSGLVGYLLATIVPISVNPTVSPATMPWVTPGFITAFLAGGIPFLLLWIISLAIHFIMYLPFFKIDDKNAYEEEQKGVTA